MPTPPPIKMPTEPDRAEDVPPRILDKVQSHGDDLAPTSPTPDMRLHDPWPKLALAAAAGYVLGFAIHGR